MQLNGLNPKSLHVNYGKNLLDDLPNELLINFFSYLKIKELSCNVLVSKKFKQITLNTASFEQLLVLKNLVKTFIHKLNPDLYAKEINELKIFCDNKYLSKSINLIGLKNDLEDSYRILANILKEIPYSDLKIEEIITQQDLVNSPFLLYFANILSFLKLEKSALKEEDNLKKIALLKEMALDAVHWDFSDKTLFINLLRHLAYIQGENSVAIGLKLGAHLSLASPLLAKSQIPIVEDLISKLPESFIKTHCELEFKLFAPYWNKNNHELILETTDLLQVYSQSIEKINELKQTLPKDVESKTLEKFLSKLDLGSDSTESIHLERFIAKFKSEPQVTELLNHIVDLVKGYKKERAQSLKSLEIVLSLLSARNRFNSVIKIAANSSNSKGLDKLPWDNYILLNSPITFSLEYLDKIPIQAAQGILPRQKCFTTIITRFVRNGFSKKALALAAEYDQKYKGEMMVERSSEIVEKYKNL